MPSNLLGYLQSKELLTPKECFSNCLGALIQLIGNDKFEVSYVLCDIHAKDGSVLEHAILKVNGDYVDPTLEAQKMHKEVEYVIHKEFSTKEMIKLLVERFGLDEMNLMFQGIKPFWPLNRIGEHEYAFVDA